LILNESLYFISDMVEFVNALQSASRPGTADSTTTTQSTTGTSSRPAVAGEEKPPGTGDKHDDEDEHMSLD
jgi:hypothetical protein